MSNQHNRTDENKNEPTLASCLQDEGVQVYNRAYFALEIALEKSYREVMGRDLDPLNPTTPMDKLVLGLLEVAGSCGSDAPDDIRACYAHDLRLMHSIIAKTVARLGGAGANDAAPSVGVPGLDASRHGVPMVGDEVVVVLADGWTIRSGVYEPTAPDARVSGEYVRLVRPDGNEYAYWDQDEWEKDPALVMGAILNSAAGLRIRSATTVHRGLILSFVRQHDKGHGIAWEKVVEGFRAKGISEEACEQAVNDALDAGLIYEPILGQLRLT